MIRNLGANPFSGTSRLGNTTFNRLISKTYKPYEISNNIINTMAINAREIEQDNPFYEASRAMNEILQQLYQINLKPGSEFPVIINPLKVIGESTNEQSLIPFNKPIGTPAVDSNMLSSMILKPNVNATSGLTEIQETLYSPTEKLMAKRMNKNIGTA